MAIPAQDLFSEGTCFACYGASTAQIMKLALMVRYVQSVNPGADVSPQALLEYGKCYACMGLSLIEIIELSLLDLIYQSGGAVSGDLNWGPNPQGPVLSINVADFEAMFSGNEFTELTYNNPTALTQDLDFTAVVNLTSLTFQNLTTVLNVVGPSASIVTLLFPSLVTVGTNFGLSNSTTLVTLNVGALMTVGNDFTVQGSSLVTLDVGSLTTVGNGFDFSNCPFLVTSDAGSLTTVGGNFTASGCTLLATMDVSALTTMGGNFYITETVLTSLAFPALVTVVGDFQFDTMPNLVNASLPLVVSLGGLYASTNPSLTSVSLPSLTTVSGLVNLADNLSLTTFHAPIWLPTDGTTINFNNNALDDTSVNQILARCVAAGVTTCTIDLSAGTNAAPTGQGIIDSAALTLAGNTVTTN